MMSRTLIWKKEKKGKKHELTYETYRVITMKDTYMYIFNKVFLVQAVKHSMPEFVELFNSSVQSMSPITFKC